MGNFHIEEVELQDAKKGEVLVKIVGLGVCHTDMLAQDQDYPVTLPAVLGHDAGVVVKAGESVTSVETGDHVASSFSSCGECKSCKQDKPFDCFPKTYYWCCRRAFLPTSIYSSINWVI